MYRLASLITLRELLARPGRALLFIGSVAVGLAMVTAMRVATDRIVGGYAERLVALGGKADLQVNFGSGENGFAEDTRDQALAVEGVAAASAVVRGTLVADDGEVLELFGLDLLDADLQQLYEFSVLEREADDFTILNDPAAIFISKQTAATQKLGVNDTVWLAGVLGRQQFRVRGIIEPPNLGGVFGSSVVGMFLPAAQAVTGRAGSLDQSLVDQLDIRVQEGHDVDVVAAALQAVLPQGLLAARPMGRRSAGEATLVGLRSTLVGMSCLGLLAAGFILYAATGSHITRRAGEISALIAIGAERHLLVLFTVAEAFGLGALGATIGVGLGIALAGLIVGDIAVGMSLNYSLQLGEHSGRAAYGAILLQHALLGGCAAALAAVVPARELLRMSPVPNAYRFGLAFQVTEPGGGLLLWLPTFGLCASLAVLAVGVRATEPAWVSVGGITAVFFLVLLASLPARLLVRWLGRLFARHGGIAGRIAGEEVERSWARIATTISAMGLCIAVAITAGSLARSFRSSVADWYGFSGDALVASRRIEGGWLNAPLDAALAERLRLLPEVAAVETLRVAQGQPYRGSRLAVSAVSPGFLAEIFSRSLASCNDCDAAQAAVSEGSGVIISRNLAARFGLRIGDDLRMATPEREVVWPIVALISDYVSDRGSVLVGDATYRELWREPLVNYFAVFLAPQASVVGLRRAVEREVSADYALTVMATEEMVANVEGMIAEAFADVDAIQLLVVVITLAAILNFLISSVSRRRREFGLLRVAGAEVALLRRAAALEAVCLAVAASVIGGVVGFAATFIWVEFCYPVLVGYVLDLSFAWPTLLVCFSLATASAVLASVATVSFLQRGPLASAIAVD